MLALWEVVRWALSVIVVIAIIMAHIGFYVALDELKRERDMVKRADVQHSYIMAGMNVPGMYGHYVPNEAVRVLHNGTDAVGFVGEVECDCCQKPKGSYNRFRQGSITTVTDAVDLRDALTVARMASTSRQDVSDE